MKSKDLSEKGFVTWYPLVKNSVSQLSKQIGVYVFRNAGGECFGRLKGSSDILYIGSTKKGFRTRLGQYLNPGRSQWTDIRINEYAKNNKIEFSCAAADEPKNLEHDLLRKYLSEHNELPPLNASNIRKLEKQIRDEIRISNEEIKVIKKIMKKLKGSLFGFLFPRLRIVYAGFIPSNSMRICIIFARAKSLNLGRKSEFFAYC